MRKITNNAKSIYNEVRHRVFMAAKSGEGYLDVLIKILITVILGAALLGLLRVAIPDLFNDIINKIKTVFTI